MAEETLHFKPVLHTERLTLTLFDPNNEADCEQLAVSLAVIAGAILNVPDVKKNIEQALTYYRFHGRIEPKFLGGRRPDRAAIWQIRLGPNSPDGKCIGTATMIQRSVIPDQGWGLDPEHRGKGYATEAAKEVLRYFREELGMHDIMAPTHPNSPKSRGVALRLGYVAHEEGLKYEDGVTLLQLNMLPGATPLPEGLVLERFGRQE